MASNVNGRKAPTTSVQPGAPTVDPANGKPEQQDLDEDIPPLTHIMSTIFVPLTEDLLKPIEPPKDRVEQLERTLASLDANERKVRDNIAWTYEREARRHVAAVRQTGALSAPAQARPTGWDEAEAEAHIARMAAPATTNPAVSYHLPPEKIAEFKAYELARPDFVVPDGGLTPHERTSREALLIANRGVRDLEGYSNYHIRGIRERLNGSLEKERQARAASDRPRS